MDRGITICPDVCPVTTSPWLAPSVWASPFLCEHGLIHVHKWDSPQGRQVNYIALAAEHQMTMGGPYLSSVSVSPICPAGIY